MKKSKNIVFLFINYTLNCNDLLWPVLKSQVWIILVYTDLWKSWCPAQVKSPLKRLKLIFQNVPKIHSLTPKLYTFMIFPTAMAFFFIFLKPQATGVGTLPFDWPIQAEADGVWWQSHSWHGRPTHHDQAISKLRLPPRILKSFYWEKWLNPANRIISLYAMLC